MFCKNCGKQIPDNSNFCPKCGVNIKSSSNQYTGYQSIKKNQNPDDASSFGYALLSFFIPVAGIVLFIVWNDEYPKRAKSCLNGIITGTVLYVVLLCCSAFSVSSYGGWRSIEEVEIFDGEEIYEVDLNIKCLK